MSAPHEDGDAEAWDLPDAHSATERRRQQRRDYHQRRTRQTPAGSGHGQRWTIAEARMALNTELTVPQAAAAVERSANAVESLRRRWRTGRLPATLADQVPRPPAEPAATRPDSPR